MDLPNQKESSRAQCVKPSVGSVKVNNDSPKGTDDALTQRDAAVRRSEQSSRCQIGSHTLQGHMIVYSGRVSHWKIAIWSFPGSLQRVGIRMTPMVQTDEG